MIELSFNDTQFQFEFGQKIAAVKNPRALLLGSGREVANRLRSHFADRDSENINRLAPDRREHFWLQVRQSVQPPVQETPVSISVTIADPRFAQKLYGGTITAKEAGALTIPVSPEAYGRTARTFEAETGLKIFLVKIGGGKGSRFENAVLAAKENGKLTVEYLLTPSVDQEADPDALPQKSDLEEAILARADRMIFRENQTGETTV